MIERTKKITIGEKSFLINFPNVGQIIDMESIKQALTNNRYGAMASSAVVSMYYALDIVDTIAFFKVCVPELTKYYDISNYTVLSNEKMKDLVTVFQKEIKPWYESVMNELKNAIDDDRK